MDEQRNPESRPTNPRRRKRTKWEIFKEAYLPVVIAGVAILLIIVFIIGSIVRSVERANAERDASIAASMSEADEALRLATEADNLLAEAAVCAEMLDYETAMDIIDSFSGNINDFPSLIDARNTYAQAQASMVQWSDPDQVLNLSFQLLIADSDRAFRDKTYGTSYKKNFITVNEFSAILEQAYANGYVLVRMSDFFTTEETENGDTVYKAASVYLPEGKKPLILTQTQVNYYNYMTDSDGDLLPDEGGAGFANKLILGADGKLTNTYVDAQGNELTGAYDLVPILNQFISVHPDFSYRGAKAVLAVTGYDGLFGYRTYPGIDEKLGLEFYQDEIDGAKQIINALRRDGYEIACYTYDNEPYGTRGTAQIQADLQKWNDEVTPILGQTDLLVFARESDIADADTVYTGEKYETLYNAGFRRFLGFCDNGTSWSTIADDHIRMGRLMVTGANLQNHPEWFAGVFTASTVIDSGR